MKHILMYYLSEHEMFFYFEQKHIQYEKRYIDEKNSEVICEC